MVDLVDHRAESHTVAKENKFVLELGALLSGASEEFHCLHPFRVCELRLTGKRMQVVYEGGEDLERARVRAEFRV